MTLTVVSELETVNPARISWLLMFLRQGIALWLKLLEVWRHDVKHTYSRAHLKEEEEELNLKDMKHTHGRVPLKEEELHKEEEEA